MSRVALISALIVLAAYGGALPADSQTAARASCQGKTLPQSISDARLALEKQPEELAPRIRLADALVDQGCYEEAVAVLEGGQAMHPHSIELTGKLRDVRSMITEQTYIQGLTQAEEAAKLQHNQLRCTKLGDLDACNAALRSTPDDVALLVAKADALMQDGHVTQAVDVYQHAAQLSPANESVKAKLSAAQARESAAVAPPAVVPQVAASEKQAAQGTAAPKPIAASRVAAVSKPAAASKAATAPKGPAPTRVAAASPPPLIEPAPAPSYSNDAPAGRSN